MAFQFWTNQTPADGTACIWGFWVNCLLAAGWTKVADSDGSVYSPAGTQVTGSGAGANGLGNTDAWMVLRAPVSGGVTRELCFQRGSAHYLWRVKYSPTGFGAGGAPSATQVPTAAGVEVVILGSGSDAAPVFDQGFFNTAGGIRFNGMGGDTTIGYSCYFWTFPTGNPTGANSTGFFMDVLAPGSFPSADADPCVVSYMSYPTYSIQPWYTPNLANTGFVHGPPVGLYNNGGSHQFQKCTPYNYTNFNTFTSGFGVADPTNLQGFGQNQWTTKDDLVPVPYGRTKDLTAPNGFKGFSQMQWYASTPHANGDQLDVGVGTRNYIYIQGWALPWDGSVLTI